MGNRREIIKLSSQQLEKDADVAREELSLAYRELKKFETALEVRKKQERNSIARKEQLALDEVGLQTFIQKQP